MRSHGLTVDYGYTVKSVHVESTPSVQTNGNAYVSTGSTKTDGVYPVTVTAEKDGVEIFKAKYALVWIFDYSQITQR
jgi:hypothetical protein